MGVYIIYEYKKNIEREAFRFSMAFIAVLWQVVQKLCVEKKWIPVGLSIDFLRYRV